MVEFSARSAAQLTRMNAREARVERLWMARAISFLACSRLTLDQHLRIRGCHLGDLRKDFAQRVRSTDHLFEHRCAQDVFTKRDRFVPHTVLGTLAIIDVRTGRVPADDFALRVEERVVANEEPAVLSILSERALLVLERDIARQPFAAFIAKPSHIFRMEDTLPESLGLDVIQSESEIVEDETVGIKRAAVR